MIPPLDESSKEPAEELGEGDPEASSAPLLSHLVELRTRLIYSFAALFGLFAVCLWQSKTILNFLLLPFQRSAGPESPMIFTAPPELFITQIKVALFAAFFFSCPVILWQIYAFVAPGLYQKERRALLPFLIATPALFLLGGGLVYFGILPLALTFFLSMEQSGEVGQVAIELLPRVSEYLGLVMVLMLAFGFCFQMPVLFSLLASMGLMRSKTLRRGRKYAVVAIFALAAFLTPPDPVSQLGLALPTLLLYELSILSVTLIEKSRRNADKVDAAETSSSASS